MIRDKEKYREWHRGYAKRRRETYLNDLRTLRGNACEFCGWDLVPKVLEWAHRPEFEKVFVLGAVASSMGWDKLMEEANKCYLLCPTCHELFDLGR
jgi:hypothetical protein